MTFQSRNRIKGINDERYEKTRNKIKGLNYEKREITRKKIKGSDYKIHGKTRKRLRSNGLRNIQNGVKSVTTNDTKRRQIRSGAWTLFHCLDEVQARLEWPVHLGMYLS